MPDSVSFEEGALCEPLSVAIHACRRGSVQPECAHFGFRAYRYVHKLDLCYVAYTLKSLNCAQGVNNPNEMASCIATAAEVLHWSQCATFAQHYVTK